MAQASPLLLLPGEIRNYIVECVITREPGVAPPPLPGSPLALSSTCRQLYNEFRSLAWCGTIFPLPWSSAQELVTKASILPPASASSIRKLQLLLPTELTDLYTDDPNRRRVKSFGFAEAGLTGLEELYFRYRPEHHEKGVGGPGREFLVQALWRILWERGVENLRRVCVVHDGTQPFLSINLLYGMLKGYGPLRRSRRWTVTSDLEHGQLLFTENGHDGEVLRQVSVIVGYSFREAEEYLDVCKQILEEKHAQVIIARRADCKYVSPLQDMSDDTLRREVENIKTLFPVTGNEFSPVLPHVQAIRFLTNVSLASSESTVHSVS